MNYEKKKVLIPVKLRKDEYDKMVRKTGELTMIEGKKVSIAELQRRILNIPNLNSILNQDSFINKRSKK